MRPILVIAIFSLIAPVVARGAEANGSLAVSRLRWDARERPLGIIQFEPRLAWVVSSAKRGQAQTAYQILVASDPGKLQPGRADLWDSKKVSSGESINVYYKGPAPQARQRAYWTVRVWDRDDRPSNFAASAWWEMGLYDEEWEGQWIGRRQGEQRPSAPDRSATLLRRTFALDKEVKRGRLYVSAFGVYEMRLNGKRVSDDVLAPGFTDYDKRVLFQTHDVTALLHRGENALGAIVGGGWCTAGTAGRVGACGREPPRVMVQLEVTLSDGSRQVVMSDLSWRAHGAPVVASHLYEGEQYDARLEVSGWDRPGFDDGDWQAAQQYDKEIERDLVADSGPSMGVTGEVKPIRIAGPAPGVTLYDLGRPLLGWARLRVRAPAGTTVSLRYGRTLGADGTIPAGEVTATDQYTTRGAGTETWEPRFSVRGFRYVELRGLARPGPDAVVARVVGSRTPPVGQLETSSDAVDRLFASIVSAQRAELLSVPGVAHGPGSAGSMLEAGLFATTACLNADVQLFLRKWVDDIRDAQLPSAAYTSSAPSADHRAGGPGAGGAGILVPWTLHRCYADRTPLDAHLASMGRWLNFVRAQNPNLLWTRELGVNHGDPREVGVATDKTLLATASLAHLADALARMARHGGPSLEPEALRYDELARGARAAFGRAFVAADGKLTSDTQTAYAVALALGTLAGDARTRAGAHLVAAIERQGRRLSTGLVGSAHLLPALSAAGRDDLAYELLLQEGCPSWQCEAKQGFPRYAYGAVAEWMYDAIGGIALDPDAPAGRHVFVRPRPGGGLTHARARFESLHGPISTEWRRDSRSFRLEVTIPANGRGTVTLPFAGKTTEGGSPLEKAPGTKVLSAGASGTVVTVESGTYNFLVEAP